MLNKLYKPCRNKLIISSILFVLAMFTLLPFMNFLIKQATGTIITPDSDFWYNGYRLIEIKNIYGFEGAQVYLITRLTLDIMWPLIYVFFLINSLTMLTIKVKNNYIKYGILSLPIIAFWFDMLENCFCSIVFFAKPNLILAYIAAIFSAIKWIVVFSAPIIVLLLTVKVIYNRIKIHKK